MTLEGRRRWWIAMGLVALLVGAVMFFEWRAILGPSTDSIDARPVEPAGPDAKLDEPLRDQAGLRLPADSPGPEQVAAASQGLTRGRVIDDSFGLPVMARLQPDVGAAVLSDPQTGEFQLGESSTGWTQLAAIAEGFETASVRSSDPQAADLIEFRLHGSRMGVVRVQYENGSPVVRAEVRWRAAIDIAFAENPYGWIDSRAHDRGNSMAALTNGSGIVQLPLRGRAIAVV